ncbi:MAG: FecR domain-containing protein [Candidatus Pseudobacter hemicellulosilyticus]|uniref:FecR domain-containing protein n=1 Tax=Candidatus Pseudobacter hemicellulosilyticus TaxID=3121375 RepID=A0AAJ5WNN6_9BACT|nr:MAG: FecR domain-containing protein [Pseudobacter sp.]
MEKNFASIEDIIADEGFQSWYAGMDDLHSREWAAWMARHPEQLPLVEEARHALQQLVVDQRPLAEGQQEAAERRLMLRLRQEGALVPMHPASVRPKRRWYWAAAAAVLLLAAGSWFFWFSLRHASVQTAFGEIREQQLPDGSTVVLNANSELRFSEGWEKGSEREVWLKGEAFFHVSKMPDHKQFIVHADQLDIIVTGTQFNVVNRQDMTNVMLTEGGVLVQSQDGQRLTLTPGDYVTFSNNRLQRWTAKEETVLAWREKKLIFENTPLKTAVQQIEALYGVTIRLEKESIGEKPISGILPNDNLDALLQALEATNVFRVVRKDNGLIIIQ